MKTVIEKFVLSAGTLVVAGTLLTLPETKIEVPALSLGEIAAQSPSALLAAPIKKFALPPLSFGEEVAKTPPLTFGPSESGQHRDCLELPTLAERPIAKMPVIVAADVDPKMVKHPGSSVDFKLIVKNAGGAPGK